MTSTRATAPTDPRRKRIAACCERLSLATQRALPNTDDAKRRRRDELDVYCKALEYLPIGAIEAAADDLCRTASRYPTAQQWREAADAASASLASRRPPPLLDDGEPSCADCRDTGLVDRTCAPGGQRCGRPQCAEAGAPEHRYMAMCPCRPTNPVIAQRRATGRRTAQRPSRSR